MASRTAYPPVHHHSTRRIAPAVAQEQLARFLAQTSSNPHLHPDAMLDQSGVQFPAQSGPQGGLALHHLRRIAAGLRGENLVAETREQLHAMFTEEDAVRLPAGDDSGFERTALKKRQKSKREQSAERVAEWADGGEDVAAASGAVDAAEYAHAQKDVDEELGNDILSGTGEQRSHVPKIRVTKTLNDKQAKKDAKKVRRLAEKKVKETEKRKAAAG